MGACAPFLAGNVRCGQWKWRVHIASIRSRRWSWANVIWICHCAQFVRNSLMGLNTVSVTAETRTTEPDGCRKREKSSSLFIYLWQTQRENRRNQALNWIRNGDESDRAPYIPILHWGEKKTNQTKGRTNKSDCYWFFFCNFCFLILSKRALLLFAFFLCSGCCVRLAQWNIKLTSPVETLPLGARCSYFVLFFAHRAKAIICRRETPFFSCSALIDLISSVRCPVAPNTEANSNGMTA